MNLIDVGEEHPAYWNIAPALIAIVNRCATGNAITHERWKRIWFLSGTYCRPTESLSCPFT